MGRLKWKVVGEKWEFKVGKIFSNNLLHVKIFLIDGYGYGFRCIAIFENVKMTQDSDFMQKKNYLIV